MNSSVSSGAVAAPQYFAYCFEAKGIQNYILDGGRLRDMVKASSLIDSLAGPALDQVVNALSLKPDYVRRAAGAITAVFTGEQERARFRQFWSLIVQQTAPGLEFVQGSGEAANSLEAVMLAQESLLAARNDQPVVMPVAGPFAARAPRTGGAASAFDHRDREWIDGATDRKRNLPALPDLTAKLKLEYLDERKEPVDVVWPVNLNREDKADVFPFRDSSQYLAIVHADGNGLGQFLMKLADVARKAPNIYVRLFSGFSQGLEVATCAAASAACQHALKPEGRVMPARPFVLGGDDLGFIVRGDLALEFTRQFLTHFEIETENFISKLAGEFAKEGVKLNLPARLTACAGIAFVKAHQPFHMAYDLAESLCTFAKRDAKSRIAADGAVPACLAFHRITTSMIDDYAEIVKRELVVQPAVGQPNVVLSRQPYYVGTAPKDCAALDDLLNLTAQLGSSTFGTSALRDVLGRAGVNFSEAVNTYKRWRQMTAQRDAESKTTALKMFDETMAKLLSGFDAAKHFGAVAGAIWQTPLYDALTWRAILGEADNDRDTDN